MKAINNISQAAMVGQTGAGEKGELGEHVGSYLSMKWPQSSHAFPPPSPIAQM